MFSQWAGELETLQSKIDSSELVVLENPVSGASCLAFSPELEGVLRCTVVLL